jgi:hypothetical protein
MFGKGQGGFGRNLGGMRPGKGSVQGAMIRALWPKDKATWVRDAIIRNHERRLREPPPSSPVQPRRKPPR